MSYATRVRELPVRIIVIVMALEQYRQNIVFYLVMGTPCLRLITITNGVVGVGYMITDFHTCLHIFLVALKTYNIYFVLNDIVYLLSLTVALYFDILTI